MITINPFFMAPVKINLCLL